MLIWLFLLFASVLALVAWRKRCYLFEFIEEKPSSPSIAHLKDGSVIIVQKKRKGQ
jgi:hypothetical protein